MATSKPNNHNLVVLLEYEMPAQDLRSAVLTTVVTVKEEIEAFILEKFLC